MSRPKPVAVGKLAVAESFTGPLAPIFDLRDTIQTKLRSSRDRLVRGSASILWNLEAMDPSANVATIQFRQEA